MKSSKTIAIFVVTQCNLASDALSPTKSFAFWKFVSIFRLSLFLSWPISSVRICFGATGFVRPWWFFASISFFRLLGLPPLFPSYFYKSIISQPVFICNHLLEGLGCSIFHNIHELIIAISIIK